MNFLVMLVPSHQHIPHGLGEQCVCSLSPHVQHNPPVDLLASHNISTPRVHSEPSKPLSVMAVQAFLPKVNINQHVFHASRIQPSRCVCIVIQGPCQGVKSCIPGEYSCIYKLSFIQTCVLPLHGLAKSLPIPTVPAPTDTF